MKKAKKLQPKSDRRRDAPERVDDATLRQVTGGNKSAGAGKAKLDPFSISRKIDKASPGFF